MAALDRCWSYRQRNAPPCKIIAIGNTLVSSINLAQYNTKLLEIEFLHSGLQGSKKATLSYEPLATRGHIWLVDKNNNRNCKGQWYLHNEHYYLWHIKCFDGLKASGTINNPIIKTGMGKGVDNSNRKIVFTFSPKNKN